MMKDSNCLGVKHGIESSSVVITATVTSTTEERSAGANNTYTDTSYDIRLDLGCNR